MTMETYRPTLGANSPTHHTGINLHPAVTGWAVWFLSSQQGETGFPDAARIVEKTCLSRGLRPQILELPSPEAGDIEGRLANGQMLIVVAASLPPAAAGDRILLVAENPPTFPLRAVIPPGGTAQDVALKVLQGLEASGFIPPAGDEVYSPEEEERLRKALDDLGYL